MRRLWRRKWILIPALIIALPLLWIERPRHLVVKSLGIDLWTYPGMDRQVLLAIDENRCLPRMLRDPVTSSWQLASVLTVDDCFTVFWNSDTSIEVHPAGPNQQRTLLRITRTWLARSGP